MTRLLTTAVSDMIFRWSFVELLVNECTDFISESQRNLILQHHNFIVFQKSYLSRYITIDTQAAYRDLESQTTLMRVISEMSRTIDRRRSWKLEVAQKAKVNHHSEMRLLRRKLRLLKKVFQD